MFNCFKKILNNLTNFNDDQPLFNSLPQNGGLRNLEPLLYDELVRRQRALLPELEKQKIKNNDNLFRVYNLHIEASAGHLEAIYYLSERYFTGDGVPEDLFFAYRLVRYAAEQGLPQAFPVIGKCYSRGIGTSVNAAEALRWFQKYDYSDDSEVLAFFGWCHFDGIGLPKDLQKAFDYIVAAAEKGHPNCIQCLQVAAHNGHAKGQYFLGCLYQFGDGLPADIQTALHWFIQSAEQGYADAQCRLGILYLSGENGVESDPETAVQWFRLAAAQNDEVAQCRLARCSAFGIGTEQNFDEAAKIWTECAKECRKYPQGEPISQYELARLKLNKDYSGNNPKEAVKRLRKSAQQDYVPAQTQLGIYLYEGLGDIVKQNLKEARRLFYKAAKQNDSVAQYYLGEIYADGNGVPSNRKDAFKWFQKSANDGYVPAQQKLAYYYLNGIGTNKNENAGYFILASLALWGDDEALTLLKSAAISGNAAAEYGMSLYILNKTNDAEESRMWLEKAAEQGNTKAQCSLAILYENEGDNDQRIHYFRLAAEQGDAESQTRLGLALENCSDRKAPENEEAFKWMKAAADQEHPDANYFLGNFYRDGTWVENDYPKAFACFMKAAELGNSDGMERLGNCYANGSEVQQDDTVAFEMYRRSAELGNPKGQYRLGLCYLNGQGCVRDTETAFRWISVAASSGHPAVIPLLERDGFDIKKLSGGYKQFRQIREEDDFGENFEQAFDGIKHSIKATPPSGEK
ncbi:MAG: sel1 repeat family protein [Planctomycetaceae bacterium]|jgi:TPR repeat protein|nr:sel1 repeat family protein [Planctomycetaceae bacterium]